MAIVSAANYEAYVGASAGDETVAFLRAPVERAVKKYLGYDPEQAARTEFYGFGTRPGGVRWFGRPTSGR